MKKSTAYVLYTALLGVSIGCVSQGLVYFPYKNRAFTIGLLAVGMMSLVVSMYLFAKHHINRADPSLKSIRQPAFGQRHPYATVLIAWAVGVAFAFFIRWAFIHSSIG